MKIKNVNKILFERYISILEKNHHYETDVIECSKEYLIKMCKSAIENINDFPDDKTSRWLWYVQWVMSSRWFIKVSEERDFSRNLFHEVYKSNLIEIPQKIDLKIN